MKVFWLSKQTKERDIPMYRGHKELTNISTLNIKETSPFNYLSITNPIESNSICTLYGLKLNANNINRICLHMFDSFNKTSQSNKAGVLHVDCMTNKDFLSKRIELSTIDSIQNNNIDLLSNHYSILLPGGGLLLEFDKEVSEVNLDVQWSIEEF